MANDSPFVVTELVAMVIGWYNICQEDVLGLWVHPRYLDLVAWEHPPVRSKIQNGSEFVFFFLTNFTL